MLACFGGNGEGLRLVYSPASLSELYLLTRRAFNEAWKYRYPAVVLTDGYMLKTRQGVDLGKMEKMENIPSTSLLPDNKVVHWPNIYTAEEELNAVLEDNKKDYEKISSEIESCEKFGTDNAKVLLIAHGIVGAVARMAVEELQKKGVKVGLFRPITLRPFPKKELDKVCGWKGIKKAIVIESSFGQLARVVRDQLAPEIDVSFGYLQKPGLGIEVEEVVDFVKKLKI
jgi:2-oxoglutarate ferredoxin oxidoreductase subunit alpha